jgi:hypothetical protein
MLDLLDWKSRSQVTPRVREQLQAGALGAATMLIQIFVAKSQDDALVQAARIAEKSDLDWVGGAQKRSRRIIERQMESRELDAAVIRRSIGRYASPIMTRSWYASATRRIAAMASGTSG